MVVGSYFLLTEKNDTVFVSKMSPFQDYLEKFPQYREVSPRLVITCFKTNDIS